MSGQIHTTGGFRRITRLGPWWNGRLAIFALVVGLVAVVLARMQSNVGSRMAALEQKFRDLTAESFYAGVQMRGSLRRLNEHLLNYKFKQDPEERKAFANEAGRTREWLALVEEGLKTASEHSAEERILFGQIQAGYAHYLAEMEPLFGGEAAGGEAGAFVERYKTVREKSGSLLGLTERFVTAQKTAFDAFLKDSRRTLSSLRRLLNVSEGLLLASTLALAVLIYRGMIGPLRRELSQSQAVIQRQEKLAALGTLAAGVAHEIRNPLTAIKFRLFTLRKALPPEFADHEDAGLISAEINRLERIVKDFLQFARPSEPELMRLPVQHLLEEVCDLLRAQMERTGIVLRVENSGVIWIHADTQQIKQVLINLIQNAADSIGRNGTITLGVRSEAATLGGRSRAVAVLAVCDTGPGIAPEVEKRLFDPFFTTKAGGTGLGLPIAARIVAKHGGLLRYQTQLNRGTTFEIVLPRIEDHARTTPDH